MQHVGSVASEGGLAARDVKHAHRPGRHCGSSAIRDLLEFHGLNVTEAFCFGLGAGLGITYVQQPRTETPFMVHVRSMGFEEKVFSTLDIPFHWQSWQDQAKATEALDIHLKEGRPALLLTDIYHLPYFNSSIHFPGHAIVAWQHSEDGATILVSDTEHPGLLPVPRSKLAQARFSLMPPFIHFGSLFAPENMSAEIDPFRVRQAIIDNAKTLKQGNRHNGIAALKSWINDLERWEACENWPWLLRFAYQLIEKRGTGGGGFRKMYAEFLDEVEEILPTVKHANLPTLMRESAFAWSGLAERLKAGSEAKVFPADVIADAIEDVRVAELRYAKAALTV